jgi:hypothetical protein
MDKKLDTPSTLRYGLRDQSSGQWKFEKKETLIDNCKTSRLRRVQK